MLGLDKRGGVSCLQNWIASSSKKWRGDATHYQDQRRDKWTVLVELERSKVLSLGFQCRQFVLSPITTQKL